MGMSNAQPSRILPVILSGGSGTRLWPMSRALYPKQLMALTSELSLLQESALRVRDPERFAPPLVVCNHEHRFIIAEQLRQIGVEAQAIMLEPEGRNTAPAAAAVAVRLVESDPEALMLILPSDHVVRDVDEFMKAVDLAVPAARSDGLVAFGIDPDRPETDYG